MSERSNAAVCGTDSGYARHLRLGEVTCPPCRKAHRLAANVGALATSRALQTLRDAHPDEFIREYLRELGKIGVGR